MTKFKKKISRLQKVEEEFDKLKGEKSSVD